MAGRLQWTPPDWVGGETSNPPTQSGGYMNTSGQGWIQLDASVSARHAPICVPSFTATNSWRPNAANPSTMGNITAGPSGTMTQLLTCHCSTWSCSCLLHHPLLTCLLLSLLLQQHCCCRQRSLRLPNCCTITEHPHKQYRKPSCSCNVTKERTIACKPHQKNELLRSCHRQQLT